MSDIEDDPLVIKDRSFERKFNVDIFLKADGLTNYGFSLAAKLGVANDYCCSGCS